MPKTLLPLVRKTRQMRKIESDHGGSDIRIILKDLYEQHGSQAEVAKSLGLDQATISIWAARLGIIFTSKPVAEIGAAPAPVTA